MSIETSQRVWTESHHTGSALLALLALADRADDDGYCWPSIADIAQRARVSERQVKRILEQLEASGELYIVRSAGRGRKSEYLVLTGQSSEKIVRALIVRLGVEVDAAQAITAEIVARQKGDIQGEKVTPASPFERKKGDIQGQKKVTPSAIKGDIQGEKVTSSALKGDMAPEKSVDERKEPSNNLVGGYTNQPTNGAVPPPANRTIGDSPSLALLLEMGVGETVAEELIQMRSFEQIRRQVFGWLKERRAGKAEIGLLVYRIRKDASCPDPDPDIDRELWRRYQTPEEKQEERKLNQELAEMLHRRPKPTPTPETPAPDDPWRITVAETATQMPYGVLERAQAEIVGEDQEVQIWRIELDVKDAAHLPWLQARGLTLLRRTLASCVGRAVRVDVVLPDQVAT